MAITKKLEGDFMRLLVTAFALLFASSAFAKIDAAKSKELAGKIIAEFEKSKLLDTNYTDRLKKDKPKMEKRLGDVLIKDCKYDKEKPEGEDAIQYYYNCQMALKSEPAKWRDQRVRILIKDIDGKLHLDRFK